MRSHPRKGFKPSQLAPKPAIKKLLNTLQLRQDFDYHPAGLRWRSNTLFIVSTIAMGMFTDLFLYGLVVPIFPFLLKERVGVPEDQIQSTVSALLAAFGASSVAAAPIVGVIADRVATRQAPFLVGIAALFASTLLLFLGTTVPVLAIARVLQGISASLVWTIGLALCIETVGPENLGKTVGSIFSFISVGAFAAPLLGGVLYEKTGLTGVFALGTSLLAIDFVMRILVIEKKIARKYDPEIDSDTNNDSTDTNNNSIESPPAEEEAHQESESTPLLSSSTPPTSYYSLPEPSTLSRTYCTFPILLTLSDPQLLSALILSFVQAALLGAFDATVPSYSSETYGFTALRAGLLFLPLGIFDLILGPVFGWAVDRYSTKPVAVGSYFFLVPVFVCFQFADRHLAVYATLLGLCGIGLAGVGAPGIVEAGAVVERYYEGNRELFGSQGPYAQLYGLTNLFFSLGLTLGPEVAGGLKDAIGYGDMNAVLGGICAATGLLSLVFIGGRLKWGKKGDQGV